MFLGSSLEGDTTDPDNSDDIIQLAIFKDIFLPNSGNKECIYSVSLNNCNEIKLHNNEGELTIKLLENIFIKK